MKNQRRFVGFLALILACGCALGILWIQGKINPKEPLKVSAKENTYWLSQITNTARGDLIEFQDGRMWVVFMNYGRVISYKDSMDGILFHKSFSGNWTEVKRVVKREPVSQEYYHLSRIFLGQLVGLSSTNK